MKWFAWVDNGADGYYGWLNDGDRSQPVVFDSYESIKGAHPNIRWYFCLPTDYNNTVYIYNKNGMCVGHHVDGEVIWAS